MDQVCLDATAAQRQPKAVATGFERPAIRVVLPPALTASSRQRCSTASSRSGLGSSFLRG
jgi:hypothetical protein